MKLKMLKSTAVCEQFFSSENSFLLYDRTFKDKDIYLSVGITTFTTAFAKVCRNGVRKRQTAIKIQDVFQNTWTIN